MAGVTRLQAGGSLTPSVWLIFIAQLIILSLPIFKALISELARSRLFAAHNKKARLSKTGFLMAGVTRLELATSCVTGRRSNQLSYTPTVTTWYLIHNKKNKCKNFFYFFYLFLCFLCIIYLYIVTYTHKLLFELDFFSFSFIVQSIEYSSIFIKECVLWY